MSKKNPAEKKAQAAQATASIRLPIHDMIVLSREVRIQSTCPSCGADLTKYLKAYEYQLYSRYAQVINGELEHQGNIEGFDGEYSEEWKCGECDYVLVTSNCIQYDEENVTQLIKDLFALLDRRTIDGRRPH